MTFPSPKFRAGTLLAVLLTSITALATATHAQSQAPLLSRRAPATAIPTGDFTDPSILRLRYVDPEPYSQEEFQKTHDWLVSWGLIQPEGYDALVDSRAN